MCCYKELIENEKYICSSCFDDLPVNILRRGNVLTFFEYKRCVRTLIKRLKYDRRGDIGYILGQHVAKKILKANIKIENNIILVPVPLHRKRKNKRGYNQAERIADGIASILKLEVDNDVVSRLENNTTQTKLDSKQRQKNVKGIFELNNISLSKRYAIVDDVVTTGATTNEIVRLLENKGIEDTIVIGLATPKTSDKFSDYEDMLYGEDILTTK